MSDWPLWEAFCRSRQGLAHRHVGSLRAADSTMALENARDLFTRRGDVASLWVVPSAVIRTSDPDDREAWFDTEGGRLYRQADDHANPAGTPS